jgi:hypothetical protein
MWERTQRGAWPLPSVRTCVPVQSLAVVAYGPVAVKSLQRATVGC